ncbi:MAG: TRAP transporter small permease subunit [Pseudomonadota bacterium]
MLVLIGDILMGIVWAILLPALALPLASLVTKPSKLFQVLAVITLPLAVYTAYGVFSALAVDLIAPDLRLVSPITWCLGILTIGILSLLVATHSARTVTDRIAKALSPIVTTIGKGMGALVFTMAGIQFGVVVLRYVFGWNSIFLQESVIYLYGSIFLLAAGYALTTNDHVRVDIFYGDASPKRKALIDLAGVYLFLFPFCFLIVGMAGAYVGNSWAAFEGSTEQSGIQAVFLLKSLIPTFAILLLAAGFLVASDATKVLTGLLDKRFQSPSDPLAEAQAHD